MYLHGIRLYVIATLSLALSLLLILFKHICIALHCVSLSLNLSFYQYISFSGYIDANFVNLIRTSTVITYDKNIIQSKEHTIIPLSLYHTDSCTCSQLKRIGHFCMFSLSQLGSASSQCLAVLQLK